MKQAILLFFLILCSFSVHAQSMEEKMDFYVNESLSGFNIPALELAVVNGDSILFSKSYPSIEDTAEQFYIGSLSKSLTAFAVLTLVQDSLLSLEDRVNNLIPGLFFSSYEDEITIRHLLNHTSGISKKDGFKALPTLSELDPEEFYINIRFKPGTQHEYSNLNYSILGLIIERVTGLSFDAYLDSAVLKKMNMPNTGVSEVNPVDQHKYWGIFPVKSSQLRYKKTAIPAGFILSTTQDMANYLITNLNHGNYHTHQILDSLLVDEMHSPWDRSNFGYAMGWKKGIYNGTPFLQHLGSTATSAAAMFIVPEKNLGLIMLTNSNSFIFSEELAEGLLGILVESEPKATTKKELTLRIAVLLFTLILISHFFYRLLTIKKKLKSLHYRKAIFDLAFSIVFLSGFIYFFPVLADVPFKAFIKLQPDLGTLALILFLFPVITHSIMLLKLSWEKYSNAG